MDPQDAALTSALQRFALSDAVLIAQTGLARIFKAQRGDGQAVVLKLYLRGDMGNEAAGLSYLRALRGQGVVQIFAAASDAVVMEWVAGPSLAELARAGRDTAAAERLGRLAETLLSHAAHGDGRALTPLRDWFAALFDVRFAGACPPRFIEEMQQAQTLARDLLQSQMRHVALHGDLHHGNVHDSTRGDLAFDAKGLWGDPAYELANAFRHPSCAPDLVRDPDRIARLAQLWAPRLDTTPARLLGWAVAKCALSIVWRSGGTVQDDAEADLLSALHAAKKKAEH